MTKVYIQRVKNEMEQFWFNEPKENDNRQFSIEWPLYLRMALFNSHIETIYVYILDGKNLAKHPHRYLKSQKIYPRKNINACTFDWIH